MASASVAGISKSSFQSDSDIHITYEDQQKINKFARHNALLEDYKEDLKHKQDELKNLEDASDELLLMDDDGSNTILYHQGEIFLYQDMENTQKMLEEAKTQVISQIKDLEAKCTDVRNAMSDMKTLLYAKFGNRINLEAEEE